MLYNSSVTLGLKSFYDLHSKGIALSLCIELFILLTLKSWSYKDETDNDVEELVKDEF